jgi:hypothetical protein
LAGTSTVTAGSVISDNQGYAAKNIAALGMNSSSFRRRTKAVDFIRFPKSSDQAFRWTERHLLEDLGA